MTVRRAVKHYSCLKALAKAKTVTQRRKVFASAPACIYSIIIDITKQILKGSIPIQNKQKENLKRYKNHLRKLTSKSSLKQKKRIVNQQGGFLPALIKPALSILAALVTDKLMRK